MRAAARRFLTATALTTAALLVGVLPALAHASLDVTSAPVDTDLDLTVLAPLERDSSNQRIEARFPAGFDVLSCSGPTGWLCEHEPAGDGTLVTWETVSLAQRDIAFKVRVHTPSTPGTRLIPVVQTYADGTEAAWIGDGGDEPAPVLELTSASSAPERSTASPAPHTAPSEPDTTDSTRPDTAQPATTTETGEAPATPASPPAEQGGSEDGPAADEPAASDAAAAPVTDAAPVDDPSPAVEAAPDTDTSDTPTDATLAVAPGDGDDEGAAGVLPLVALALLVAAAGAAGWWWTQHQR